MLPEHPVDALTLAIVRAVAGAADHCEAPFMIVGAAARDIILENVHGIAPRRATRDVDFAFALESWVEFDRLKTRLCETGTFEADPDTQHRLFFGPGAGGSDEKRPGGFAVDLVPFGTIAGADNTLAWPPGLDLLMNLAGDAEAMKSLGGLANEYLDARRGYYGSTGAYASEYERVTGILAQASGSSPKGCSLIQPRMP